MTKIIQIAVVRDVVIGLGDDGAVYTGSSHGWSKRIEGMGHCPHASVTPGLTFVQCNDCGRRRHDHGGDWE